MLVAREGQRGARGKLGFDWKVFQMKQVAIIRHLEVTGAWSTSHGGRRWLGLRHWKFYEYGCARNRPVGARCVDVHFLDRQPDFEILKSRTLRSPYHFVVAGFAH